MFPVREFNVNRKHFSVKTLVSTYLEYFFPALWLLRPIQSSHVTLRDPWKCGGWGAVSQFQCSGKLCVVSVLDYRNFHCEVDRVVSEPGQPSPSCSHWVTSWSACGQPCSLLTHAANPTLVCCNVAEQLPDIISLQSLNTALCISTR